MTDTSDNKHIKEERGQISLQDNDDDNEERKYSGVHRQGEKKAQNLDGLKSEPVQSASGFGQQATAQKY